MRAALEEWPDRTPPPLRAGVADLARRLALGQPMAESIAATDGFVASRALAAIASVHVETGCDAAGLIDALATSLERQAGLLRDAHASTSGPKASGRLVAALPVAFIPLLPAARWRFDRVGWLLLVAGVFLLGAGMWWIARLMPRPPGPDGAADLAELAVPALEAGLSPARALETCATALPDLSEEIERCRQRVQLGASWADALGRATHPGLVAMGAIVRRSEDLGSSIAPALRRFAAERRAAAESAFDAATRRAPVWMVLPLVLCVLPSFVLLALAPFLRGLSLHS